MSVSDGARRPMPARKSASAPGPGSSLATASPQEWERLVRENEQLRRALHSRPLIDQARGMIMALVPCSSETAWELLVNVSQNCNVKLRDLAGALVATTSGEPLPPEMGRRVHRALRGLRDATGTAQPPSPSSPPSPGSAGETAH